MIYHSLQKFESLEQTSLSHIIVYYKDYKPENVLFAYFELERIGYFDNENQYTKRTKSKFEEFTSKNNIEDPRKTFDDYMVSEENLNYREYLDQKYPSIGDISIYKYCSSKEINHPSLNFKLSEVVHKEYVGDQKYSNELFIKDQEKFESKGYEVTNKEYFQGSYSTASFVIALLFSFLIIGLIPFIYMLIVKPKGTLHVTYKLKSLSEKSEDKEVKENLKISENQTHISIADEIKKFAELRDQGIITEEEFKKKKSELL